MPRQLKEIKNFTDGIILNASERDIPDTAATYSLNVDPLSEAGILKGIKNDRLLLTSNASMTVSSTNLNWSETTNNNTTNDIYNASQIILDNIDVFQDEEHAMLDFIGSKGQKELLHAYYVEPIFSKIINSSGADFEPTPLAAIGANDKSFQVVGAGAKLNTTADAAHATVDGFDAVTNTATIYFQSGTVSHHGGDTYTFYSPDGRLKTYKVYEDSSGASGTTDSDGYVRIQLNGEADTTTAIRTQFINAISHADGHHTTRITCDSTTADQLGLTWVHDPITKYVGKGSYFSLVTAGVTFTGRSGFEILKVESVIQPGDEGAVTDNSLWTFNIKRRCFGTKSESFDTSAKEVYSNLILAGSGNGTLIPTKKCTIKVSGWSNYAGNHLNGSSNIWFKNGANTDAGRGEGGYINLSNNPVTFNADNNTITISKGSNSLTKLRVYAGDYIYLLGKTGGGSVYTGNPDGDFGDNLLRHIKVLKKVEDGTNDVVLHVDNLNKTVVMDETTTGGADSTLYFYTGLIVNNSFDHKGFGTGGIGGLITPAHNHTQVCSGWIEKNLFHSKSGTKLTTNYYTLFDNASSLMGYNSNYAVLKDGSTLIDLNGSDNFWEDDTTETPYRGDLESRYFPFTGAKSLAITAAYNEIGHTTGEHEAEFAQIVTINQSHLPFKVDVESKLAKNYIIKMSNEYMRVVSVTGNTATVIRGIYGSTIAEHAANSQPKKSINQSLWQYIPKERLKSGQEYRLTFYASISGGGSTNPLCSIALQLNGGYFNKEGRWQSHSLSRNIGYKQTRDEISTEEMWIDNVDLMMPNGDTPNHKFKLDTTYRKFEYTFMIPSNIELETDMAFAITNRGEANSILEVDMLDLTALSPINVIVNKTPFISAMSFIDNSGKKDLLIYDAFNKNISAVKNFTSGYSNLNPNFANIEKSSNAPLELNSSNNNVCFTSKNREVHVGFGSAAEDSKPQWIGYLNSKIFGVANNNGLYQDTDEIETFDTVNSNSFTKLCVAGEYEYLAATWDDSAKTLTITNAGESSTVGDNIVVREWMDTNNSWTGAGVWVVTTVNAGTSIVCKRYAGGGSEPATRDKDPDNNGFEDGTNTGRVNYRPYYYYAITKEASHVYRIFPEDYMSSPTAVTDNDDYRAGKSQKSAGYGGNIASITTCHNKKTDGTEGGRIYVLTKDNNQIVSINVDKAVNAWDNADLEIVSTLHPQYHSYTKSNDSINGNIDVNNNGVGDTAVEYNLAEIITPVINPSGVLSDILETKGPTSDTSNLFNHKATNNTDNTPVNFDTRLWIQFRPGDGEDAHFTEGSRFLFCGRTTSDDHSSGISLIKVADRTPPTTMVLPSPREWRARERTFTQTSTPGPVSTTSFVAGPGINSHTGGNASKYMLWDGNGPTDDSNYYGWDKSWRVKELAPVIDYDSQGMPITGDVNNLFKKQGDLSEDKPCVQWGHNVGWVGDYELDMDFNQDYDNWDYGTSTMTDIYASATIQATDIAKPKIQVARYGLMQLADNDCDGIIDGTGLVVPTSDTIVSGTQRGSGGELHRTVCSHVVALIGGCDKHWASHWGRMHATSEISGDGR